MLPKAWQCLHIDQTKVSKMFTSFSTQLMRFCSIETRVSFLVNWKFWYKLGRHVSEPNLQISYSSVQSLTTEHPLINHNGDSMISPHSDTHNCNVSLSLAGCKSPRTFININFFRYHGNVWTTRTLMCGSHTPLHTLSTFKLNPHHHLVSVHASMG